MPSSRVREARKRRRAAELEARVVDSLNWMPRATQPKDPVAIAEKMRIEVDDLIRRLEILTKKHDPLDLIAPFATMTQVAPVGALETDSGKASYQSPYLQADLEYALSFALALPFPSSISPVTHAVIEEFGDILLKLREAASWHGIIRAHIANPDPRRFEMQGAMRDWTTVVRGDNYWSAVGRLVCEELFAPVENLMWKSFGFRPKDIFAFIERIEDTIVARVRNAVVQVGSQLEQLSELLHGPENFEEYESLSSDIQKSIASVGQKSIFEVVPQNDIELRIAEQLALQFAENAAFLEGPEDLRGWPLGETLVREKPLVFHDGRFYAPACVTLRQSARLILESLIKKANETYFKQNYLAMRDAFLERKVLEVMQNWFGAPNVYGNLYYQVNEGGKRKRCELDCLVNFGDVILLVEAKAKALAPKARRGELGRLESDLKKLIQEAHRQAARAMTYLCSTSLAQFTDEKDREVLVVKRDRISRVVSVNVTLDDLSPIAPNVSRLFQSASESNSILQWTVSLVDLMVLRDILSSPTAFLHYLHRREMTARHGPPVRCSDELDYLMLYLQQNLYIEEADFGPGKVAIATIDGSFTDKLDEYYARIANNLPATKPTQKVPEGLADLLAAIDRNPHAAGPTMMCSLLDLGDDGRRMASDQIQNLEQRYEDDSEPHTVTFDPIGGSVILLACGHEFKSRETARVWAERWLTKPGIRAAYVTTWKYPLRTSKPVTWKFVR